VTGFIVESIDEAVEAVHRITSLDRRVCRRVVVERFGLRRMYAVYFAAYQADQWLHQMRQQLSSRSRGSSISYGHNADASAAAAS
jgi:hypothetical protein